MIILIIFDIQWTDSEYEKWRQWRAEIYSEFTTKVCEDSAIYFRYIEFNNESDAALFKLRWCDRLRIERYEGLF